MAVGWVAFQSATPEGRLAGHPCTIEGRYNVISFQLRHDIVETVCFTRRLVYSGKKRRRYPLCCRSSLDAVVKSKISALPGIELRFFCLSTRSLITILTLCTVPVVKAASVRSTNVQNFALSLHMTDIHHRARWHVCVCHVNHTLFLYVAWLHCLILSLLNVFSSCVWSGVHIRVT